MTYVRWSKKKEICVWLARVRAANGHMLECQVVYDGFRDLDRKSTRFVMHWVIFDDSKCKKQLAISERLVYPEDDTIAAVEKTKELCEQALQKYL